MAPSAKHSERAQRIMNQAFTWIQEPANAFWVQEAAEGFFPDGLPGWAGEWLGSLFPAWVLFDYRDASGKTGMERFKEAFADRLTKEDERALAMMNGERFRLVKVLGTDSAGVVRFTDLTSGEVFDVSAREASQRLSTGDTCLVRLRRVKGGTDLDALAFVPSEFSDRLILAVAARCDELAARHPGYSEEMFFKDRAAEVFHMALAPALERKAPVDMGDLPEEERRILEDAVKKQFEEWLDTPLPGLSGKTPAEAAEDPGLKAELSALLDELEGRSGADAAWFKVYLAELRSRLGL